jgi:hypothetical protein
MPDRILLSTAGGGEEAYGRSQVEWEEEGFQNRLFLLLKEAE